MGIEVWYVRRERKKEDTNACKWRSISIAGKAKVPISARVRYITSCLHYGVNRSISFSNDGGALLVEPFFTMVRNNGQNGPDTVMVGASRSMIKLEDRNEMLLPRWYCM